MRLVFMGTPGFAVATLRRLASSEHQVVAVVTNPDRPKGRGRRTAPPPVKEAAQELGLPLLQPESVTAPGFAEELAGLHADLFVVVAFSILPPELLAVPRLGSVNLHPSLLPRYRGAAPIIWAVINGDTETGITTFLLNPRVDAGDILLQRPVPIDADETAGELESRLSQMGAQVMLDTVSGLADGSAVSRRQPRGRTTRAPKLAKEDARLDWAQSAASLRNRIRGTNPVPGAFTEWRGGVLKVHRAACVAASPADDLPGTVLAADPQQGLVVAASDGALRLTQVQPQGKRPMADTDLLRGHGITPGERLGLPPGGA